VTLYYTDPGVELHRGDALAVLRDLPDGSVDALITDPPYSSGGMFRGDRTDDTGTKYVQIGSGNLERLEDFAGDNRDQRAYGYWCALWLGECLRVVRAGGVACLFTDWRQLPATTDALQAGGFVWRGIVPWYKPGARPQMGRFSAACEYVVWGSRGGMLVDDASACLPGFYQANSPRERDHQTQKPLSVMRDLVRIAPDGGTILDPFMGAGTTGVAAVIEGRRFVGAEMVAHHAATAERRIRTAQRQAVPVGAQLAMDLTGDAL
jgi:site-specific DNA-methyltransferase (adenine-specific)